MEAENVATESVPPPRFTSDVSRGYLAGMLAIIPLFVSPFVLALAGYDDRKLLTFASIFLAWIIFALLITVLPAVLFGRVSGATLARWLASTTPAQGDWKRRLWWSLNGGGAVSWAMTGSAVAIASVIVVSQDPELRTELLVVVLAILVVLSSLLVTMSAFAVRYARENAVSGGAEFAKTEHPRFIDFVYMAIQVGTTFSTSDVTVTTTRMRNLVSLNSLIAFAFNTVVVALLVSVLTTNIT